ncbi:MAG: cation diffusion facilitator family transporter [Rhodovibrionaceae bacterium]
MTPGSAAAQPGMQSVARLMRLAAYASVTTAGLLILVKLGAWWLTDSVSLLSSLIDSLLDATASVIMLLAVRTATTPADEEHRFGHGKAEALASLAQAALITGSAIFLLAEAGQRLFSPQGIQHSDIGIAVMVFSIVLTFALTRFQAYVVRQTRSLAIESDSIHYLSDLLMNAAVILALVLTAQFGWRFADPVIALAIAAFILFSAGRIGWKAYNMLMDRELPPEEQERIRAIVKQHGDVRGLHDLRTRRAGPQVFIQLHLEMDGGMSLYRAHAVADAVEADLQTAFPGAEVIIHQDPSLLEEERTGFV